MPDTVLGPIDYLVVEWPDSRVTGEGFALLMDLVERDVVKILDLVFISKDADGKLTRLELSEVDHASELDARLHGLASDLFDNADIDLVGAEIASGGLAGILMYENLWAVPMWTALEASSARLVGSGRINAASLLDSLDIDPSDSVSHENGGG